MKGKGKGSISWLLLLLLISASEVNGSVGDRSAGYQRCLASCSSYHRCSTPSSSYSSFFLHPRRLIWSCTSDCSYSCLNHLTDLSLSFASTPDSDEAQRHQQPGGQLEGLPMGTQVQFHGKWPFKRLFLMQEPLSVLFSILNFWAHWRGLSSLSWIPATTGTELLRWDYMLNAWIGLNTWVWSSVFHTRDTPWTERADYFSAALSTTYGLYLSLVRLFGLYRVTSRRPQRLALQLFFALVFVAHVTYLMSHDRFDYSYNMAFNLSMGVLQIIAWLFLPLSPSAPSPRLALLLLFLSTTLEINDFPPIPENWRLLDAHAMWHLSTAGIVVIWYRFLKGDLRRVDEEEIYLFGGQRSGGRRIL